MQTLNVIFKHTFLNTAVNKKARLVFMIFALFSINTACGNRKIPLPPIEKVSQKVVIAGFQRGNRVNLSWLMPARNASDSSILNINRIDIYRLAEPLDASLTLSEADFSSRSTLVATLPVSDSDFGLKKFGYTDSLEFAVQNVRLRYAVRFVNSAGQKAAFSNFLLIEPTNKVAEFPKSLTVNLTEAALILNWLAPVSNFDGSKPVNLLGYNVYRSTSNTATAQLINKTPVTETEFKDNNFEFDKEYFYFIRAVSLGGNGEPVESLESNVAVIAAKDVFPPSAPTAITIAAAPNNLSIFFAGNTERDVEGYEIYRTLDAAVPLPQWQKLTVDLLKTNTFQDTKVESGKTYYYYLIAVDRSGNESRPSEIVSETAP